MREKKQESGELVEITPINCINFEQQGSRARVECGERDE